MIVLLPYDTKWKIVFEQERSLLLNAMKEWIVIVEHIGSTAIPEIKAKPVIDIMIGVQDLKIADLHLVKIIQLCGYDYINNYEASMPERRYFQKIEHKVKTSQIHLVEYGSEFWVRHLLFRDYLRKHTNIAKEYESFKLELASKFTDTNQYALAKTKFIREIEKLAKLELS